MDEILQFLAVVSALVGCAMPVDEAGFSDDPLLTNAAARALADQQAAAAGVGAIPGRIRGVHISENDFWPATVISNGVMPFRRNVLYQLTTLDCMDVLPYVRAVQSFKSDPSRPPSSDWDGIPSGGQRVIHQMALENIIAAGRNVVRNTSTGIPLDRALKVEVALSSSRCSREPPIN